MVRTETVRMTVRTRTIFNMEVMILYMKRRKDGEKENWSIECYGPEQQIGYEFMPLNRWIRRLVNSYRGQVDESQESLFVAVPYTHTHTGSHTGLDRGYLCQRLNILKKIFDNFRCFSTSNQQTWKRTNTENLFKNALYWVKHLNAGKRIIR